MDALCNLADNLGCSLYELSQKLPPEELELRLVHQCLKMGITFDRARQKELEKQKVQNESERFLNSCPWRKNKRT